MTPRLTHLLSACCATLAAAGSLALPATAGSAADPSHPVGLTRLLEQGTPTGRAIATFDGAPTSLQITALHELGLTVQPLRALPLALVVGDADAMSQAVTTGVAEDVYPDEVLEYADTVSSNVVSSTADAAAALRARGLTGKGVTVGVIDSGCDATHPDLADHVTHNVTLVSAEYANQPADETNTLVIPLDQGPYSNTDLGSGHGTHVAGIIAADSTSDVMGGRLGVAPDAELACFAIGAVITTTAVVTGFDYILRQPDHLDIDVINNSWGNSFRQFDPQDPVNVATKAASDAGMTVVFAAGNSGDENAEASVSPFNQAPWVISVAAGTLKRERGSFSSNGLRFDNTQAVAIGAGGHTVALGDRIGLVGPDITAPGVAISSSCSSTGTVIGPCPTHGNKSANGTSMASPHIAGAAAVLLQARPGITPAQVQQALLATASPVTGNANYFQVGFGHVNLDKAVDLVRAAGWQNKLATAWRKAGNRVLTADGFDVLRSDTWQYDAPPVTVAGSDSATYQLSVAAGADEVYLTLVYPAPGTLGNEARYTATLVGPGGELLGSTATSSGFSHGTATLRVPVASVGTYTIRVTGDYAISDPDTIDSDSVNGRVVYVNAAQLARS